MSPLWEVGHRKVLRLPGSLNGLYRLPFAAALVAQEFQQANIAVKRLGDILDMPQEPHALLPSREDTQRGAGASGQIDLISLAFRYSEHHPWLFRNLDMRFKPGHLTMLFIAHQIPKGLLVDEVLSFGDERQMTRMEVVEEDKG